MKMRVMIILIACALIFVSFGCKKSGGGSPAAPGSSPKITAISPVGAGPGIEITISGTGFGSAQGNGTVTVGGHDAPIDTWSSTEIKCTIPQSLSGGIITDLVVTTDAGKTVTQQYNITPSNTYCVMHDVEMDHYPCWAGNDYIYFCSTRGEAANWDIYRIPAKGGTPQRATFDNTPDFYPDVDPSSGEIAWSSQMRHVNNTDGDYEIFYGFLICDVPTCAVTTAMLTSNNSRDLDPAYSPQVYMGYDMAYTHEEENTHGLWKIYLNTTGPPVELTEGRQPNFSGNGQWVVYTHQDNIYKIRVDSDTPIQLTDTNHDWYPHWGWSNDKIVFQRYNGHTAEDIMVMNADGTDVQTLVGTRSWEYCPSWSPDCTKIVYYALVGGYYDIYVYVVP
jgi:TolB protein